MISTILLIIAIIGFLIMMAPIVYWICIYIKTKNQYITTMMHAKKFAHVLKITPWIYKQIELSTDSIFGRMQYEATNSTPPNRTISNERYLEAIQAIRTHFYGTVPIGIAKDMMFEYIDTKQIDILIMNQFTKANSGFFKIESSSGANNNTPIQ